MQNSSFQYEYGVNIAFLKRGAVYSDSLPNVSIFKGMFLQNAYETRGTVFFKNVGN